MEEKLNYLSRNNHERGTLTALNMKLIIVGIVVVVMNLICLFLMRYDKQCARQGKRRVPESTLFLSAGCFGALGGVLAMNIYHHKTNHWDFKTFFPLMLNYTVSFQSKKDQFIVAPFIYYDSAGHADPHTSEEPGFLEKDHDQDTQSGTCRAVYHGKAAAEEDSGKKDPCQTDQNGCLPADTVEHDHGHDIGQTHLNSGYPQIKRNQPFQIARHQGQGQK